MLNECTHPRSTNYVSRCWACELELRTQRKNSVELGAQRFWKNVERSEGCFIWKGHLDRKGYGRFSWQRRMVAAHRFGYMLAKGVIPDGMVLDHLCRTPACVNVDHLEAVSHQTNVKRGLRGDMVTHCPQGHEYTQENIRYVSGRRACRICHNARTRRDAAYWRAYRAKRTAEGRSL